jgi:hypothetical protein
MRYNFNIVTFVQDYLEDTSNEIKPELDVLVPAGKNKQCDPAREQCQQACQV